MFFNSYSIVRAMTPTLRENLLPREQLNPTVLENPRGTRRDTHGNLIWIISEFRPGFDRQADASR